MPTRETATTIKTYFETGDRPTQSEFGIFIDSAVRTSLITFADKFEGSGIGIPSFVSPTDVTAYNPGAMGISLLKSADASAAGVASRLTS